MPSRSVAMTLSSSCRWRGFSRRRAQRPNSISGGPGALIGSAPGQNLRNAAFADFRRDYDNIWFHYLRTQFDHVGEPVLGLGHPRANAIGQLEAGLDIIEELFVFPT